jgi:hypothetical protein
MSFPKLKKQSFSPTQMHCMNRTKPCDEKLKIYTGEEEGAI